MDHQDRAAIEELFRKLGEVEQRAQPRDPEAEAFIRSQISGQPGAPYYMAQTIIVQEQALMAAQQRIEELERAPAGGGFLGGLFGGGSRSQRPSYGASRSHTQQPWGSSQHGAYGMGHGRGGGFLAGAAQTAMGVAGGVVLGSMIADWMTPDAEAAGFGDAGETDMLGETGAADAGDFGGGDMDFGDF